MHDQPSHPDYLDQVKALFIETWRLPSKDRPAFLERVCMDQPAMRAEVESLLSAYDEAGTFLDELDTAGVAALLADDEDAETGRAVGPYRIVRMLGRGGMGVVYLAEDARLDRRVALKFLPPNLAADDSARRRLLTEARAAAALDHPNICTIHEIGETEPASAEAGERLFIAMAYYEGETLREKIGRGPLPLDEALDLARQITDGLGAAHRQGIVHRDVKPSNILITTPGPSVQGIVKIVDFGIARLKGAELTKPGATLGTVAYMSPEHTRGEAVDARTDLWSLGVVLYEMLTGRRPFRGESDQTVLAAIRHDAPEPVADVRPAIPAALAHIVARCLEKDAAKRYSDAEALLHDLETLKVRRFSAWRTRRWVRPGAAVALALVLLGTLFLGLRTGQGGDMPSVANRIAVLPLDNLSPEAEDAYFAEGMTEELTSRLSKLSGLRVIGRASVERYAGIDKRIDEIGQALDVSAVLTGSVRKAGDQVRVSVQLVDARTEEQLWSRDYNADVADVLAVQSQIAQRAVEALNVQMKTGEQRQLAIRGSPRLGAARAGTGSALALRQREHGMDFISRPPIRRSVGAPAEDACDGSRLLSDLPQPRDGLRGTRAL